MSHRKFSAPRHGHMGFTPKKRAKKMRRRIKAYPKDEQAKEIHLTGFMGFKAGMTHVVREVEKPGSKVHKKEVVDPVTIVECPPLVIVGITGYIETPKGLRKLQTIWAEHLSEECKRRFYKNWYKAKKTAFSKYSKNWSTEEGKKNLDREFEKMKKYCSVVRVLAHTQQKLLR